MENCDSHKRFVTCLVNTDKSFYSYPVTRLFDFGKLFQEVKQLLPRLQDGKIGLVNAKRLRKVGEVECH